MRVVIIRQLPGRTHVRQQIINHSPAGVSQPPPCSPQMQWPHEVEAAFCLTRLASVAPSVRGQGGGRRPCGVPAQARLHPAGALGKLCCCNPLHAVPLPCVLCGRASALCFT